MVGVSKGIVENTQLVTEIPHTKQRASEEQLLKDKVYEDTSEIEKNIFYSCRKSMLIINTFE